MSPRRRNVSSAAVNAVVTKTDTAQAVLLRELEQDMAGVLEPWALRFLRWHALNPQVQLARQCEVASAYAGTTITSSALKRLKERRAYREMWRQERKLDDDLAAAREQATELLPKALQVYERALDIVNREMKKGGIDQLGAARAAQGLVVPFLDRAYPKKIETQTTATVLTINLTPAQQAGLLMPEMVVSAHEIVDATDVEIIEDETR